MVKSIISMNKSFAQKDLVKAINSISTNSKIKKAIDFGCGAVLTKHLSEVGCDVLACDVSQGFLDLVSSRTLIIVKWK